MSWKPAIASMSLGRAWVHKLPYKLDQAQAIGFEGIENPSPDAQIGAAHTIRKLCDERQLTVIGLQPFMHYEGLLDREEHERRIEKMKLWFKLAKILKTDIIQIPASFLSKDKITGDLDVVVGDLRKVADMGLAETPPLKFAYENLCWSTYFDTWEKGWDIVERVDRPNFGLCLDTYNIAGRIYGDPASPTGKTLHAEEDLKQSLEEIVKTIDVNKVFYIQVVDAEKMRSPLVEGHAFYDPSQPARMSWSRNARLFAFEDGGYLPIMDVLRAIVEGLGYRGWVSMELFSRSMAVSGDEVPKEHARRARLAWDQIHKEMQSWSMK